jgi:hypothetical protein
MSLLPCKCLFRRYALIHPFLSTLTLSSTLHCTALLLCYVLGVEKREDEQASSVGDLLRDIETALDTVLDEREKQLQQQVSAALPSYALHASVFQTVALPIPSLPSLRLDGKIDGTECVISPCNTMANIP